MGQGSSSEKNAQQLNAQVRAQDRSLKEQKKKILELKNSISDLRSELENELQYNSRDEEQDLEISEVRDMVEQEISNSNMLMGENSDTLYRLQSESAALRNDVRNYNQAISGIQSSLSATAKRIDGVKSELGGKIKGVETSLSKMGSDLKNQSVRIGGIESSFGSIGDSLNSIGNSLTDINKSFDTRINMVRSNLGNRINGIESKLNSTKLISTPAPVQRLNVSDVVIKDNSHIIKTLKNEKQRILDIIPTTKKFKEMDVLRDKFRNVSAGVIIETTKSVYPNFVKDLEKDLNIEFNSFDYKSILESVEDYAMEYAKENNISFDNIDRDKIINNISDTWLNGIILRLNPELKLSEDFKTTIKNEWFTMFEDDERLKKAINTRERMKDFIVRGEMDSNNAANVMNEMGSNNAANVRVSENF